MQQNRRFKALPSVLHGSPKSREIDHRTWSKPCSGMRFYSLTLCGTPTPQSLGCDRQEGSHYRATSAEAKHKPGAEELRCGGDGQDQVRTRHTAHGSQQ